MTKLMPALLAQLRLKLMLGMSLAGLAIACSPEQTFVGSSSLNSRYTDEQPALSGNGRFLALVSNRNGHRQILLYDLQQRQLVPTPRLNRPSAIAESPSLSYTARYIVYIASDQGRTVVALYDRARQQSQILTRFYPGQIRHPSISPDGRYVVFESGRRGQWDIEMIDRGPNIDLDRPDSPPVEASPTP